MGSGRLKGRAVTGGGQTQPVRQSLSAEQCDGTGGCRGQQIQMADNRETQ